MRTRIWIEDILWFSANDGVIVEAERVLCMLEAGEQEALAAAIRAASAYVVHPLLVEACCGGTGPLAGLGGVPYDHFIQLLRDIEKQQAIEQATLDAKRRALAARRAEFARIRNDLLLAMLATGTPYVCAAEGCYVSDALHIDHLHPMSRGGSDDLSNLQFLCQRHNSEKGTK